MMVSPAARREMLTEYESNGFRLPVRRPLSPVRPDATERLHQSSIMAKPVYTRVKGVGTRYPAAGTMWRGPKGLVAFRQAAGKIIHPGWPDSDTIGTPAERR